MSLAEIQKAVDTLLPDERVQLTAWMVSRYPVLNVKSLMRGAAGLVARDEWTPAPPTEDNQPKGEALEKALRIAEQLDLGD